MARIRVTVTQRIALVIVIGLTSLTILNVSREAIRFGPPRTEIIDGLARALDQVVERNDCEHRYVAAEQMPLTKM